MPTGWLSCRRNSSRFRSLPNLRSLPVRRNAASRPHKRKDLVDDRNEYGFSNKKNPVPVDLPMIRARLAIIDRLMPEAMDKTNADAFAEAKKDLLNMQAKLSR